jgi:hypothetical protein
MSVRIVFDDAGLESLLHPFVGAGQLSAEDSQHLVAELAGREDSALLELQVLLLEALVAGSYRVEGLEPSDPNDLDAMLAAIMGRSEDDEANELAIALVDELDVMRRDESPQHVREFIASVVVDSFGSGYPDLGRLVTLVPNTLAIRDINAGGQSPLTYQFEIEHNEGQHTFVSVSSYVSRSGDRSCAIVRVLRAPSARIAGDDTHCPDPMVDTYLWRLVERAVELAPFSLENSVERPRNGEMILSATSTTDAGRILFERLTDAPGLVPWRVVASDRQQLEHPLALSAHALDRAEIRSAAESQLGTLGDRDWWWTRLEVAAAGSGAIREAAESPASFEWASLDGGGHDLALMVNALAAESADSLSAFAEAWGAPRFVGFGILSESVTDTGERVVRVRFWRSQGADLEHSDAALSAHTRAEEIFCGTNNETFLRVHAVFPVNDKERAAQAFGLSDVYWAVA